MGSWSDTSSDTKAKVIRRPSARYRVRFRHGVYPDAEGNETRADIKKYDYFFSGRQHWVATPENVDFVDETAQVTTDFRVNEHNTVGQGSRQSLKKIAQSETDTRMATRDTGLQPAAHDSISNTSSSASLSQASSYSDQVAAQYHQYNNAAISPMSSPNGNHLLDWQQNVSASLKTLQPLPAVYFPSSSSDPEEAQLFRFWVENAADWLDITNSHNVFRDSVPQLAMHNSILLNAIFLIGSQHIRQVHPSFPVKSYLYHERVSQQLIPYLAEYGHIQDEGTLVAAIFLRAFEEFHAGTNGQTNLSTYELFHGPDGWRLDMSRPLVQACFMVHIHFEIYQGLLNGSSFRVDYQTYMIPALIYPLDNAAWSNKITWECARILQWASLDSRSLNEWQELKETVDEWERERPPGFNAFFFQGANATEGKYYPELWFPNHRHVDAYQHVLICRITLAMTYPNLEGAQILQSEEARAAEITSWLKEVMATARCNLNSVSASWLAAHVMHKFAAIVQSPVDQSSIIEFLEDVDAMGWSTKLTSRWLKLQWEWPMQINVEYNNEQ
ncbi:hypothetical protein GQ44DRAFT_219125 [Phaeosphaeriaceae sp. PMI808]|nr:hypothetical protein GQ44DRAFT_219125 [Phaeosphaeriaceae sp. PMI808]